MGGPPEKYPQAGKPYGGWKPVPALPWQSRVGYVFGVTMWLWVFWRAKQDLPHKLGFMHPWEHDHGHDNEHEETHGH